MYNTVLVAVDINDNYKEILTKGIKIAKENHAELIICHIQTLVVPTVGAEAVVMNAGINEVTDYEKEELEKMKQIADFSSLKNTKIVIEHSINTVSAIVDDVSTREMVDLIVCGSSNSHGFSRFLLGSVSSGIAKHAKCDVFIVKDEIKK